MHLACKLNEKFFLKRWPLPQFLPCLNKEYLKIKVKSYGDEVPNFCEKEISKGDSNRTCFAVISLDFTLKKYLSTVQKTNEKWSYIIWS